MFQKSWVHCKEGSLYKQFLYGMFCMHLCKQSSRWNSVTSGKPARLLTLMHAKYSIQKPVVQTVFLMRFETCRRSHQTN